MLLCENCQENSEHASTTCTWVSFCRILLEAGDDLGNEFTSEWVVERYIFIFQNISSKGKLSMGRSFLLIISHILLC